MDKEFRVDLYNGPLKATDLQGRVTSEITKFNSDLTDDLFDKFFVSNTMPFDTANKYGVISCISNCASAYRNKVLKRLSQLVKFPNGTEAMHFYGACGKHLQTYQSDVKDALNSKLAGGVYFSLPPVVRKYKFYRVSPLKCLF